MYALVSEKGVDYIREFLIIQVRVYASHFPPHPIDFLSIFPHITCTTYKTQLDGVLCVSFHQFWGTHIFTALKWGRLLWLTVFRLLWTSDIVTGVWRSSAIPHRARKGQQHPAAIFLWGIPFPREFWGYLLLLLPLVTKVSVSESK